MGLGLSTSKDQELVDDQVEVGFGNAKIYYDNAEILGDTATPESGSWFWQCSYLCSQHWRVDLKVETFLWCSQGRYFSSSNQQNLDYPWRCGFWKVGIVYVK